MLRKINWAKKQGWVDSQLFIFEAKNGVRLGRVQLVLISKSLLKQVWLKVVQCYCYDWSLLRLLKFNWSQSKCKTHLQSWLICQKYKKESEQLDAMRGGGGDKNSCKDCIEKKKCKMLFDPMTWERQIQIC
jgi:hypothetical protein